MMRKLANVQRAEDLFTCLATMDMTREDVCEQTEWTRKQFYRAVQTLRDLLAENGDTISVVAEPQESRAPWLYGLRAGNQIIDEDSSRWLPGRIDDVGRRIKTMSGVLGVAVRATDGRTVHGRKARIYRMHLRRAEEEVAMMLDGEAQ